MATVLAGTRAKPLAADGYEKFLAVAAAVLLAAVLAPLIWWNARNHRVARHRTQVRGMVTGALLVAGFFTFPFGRMLGAWLFG